MDWWSAARTRDAPRDLSPAAGNYWRENARERVSTDESRKAPDPDPVPTTGRNDQSVRGVTGRNRAAVRTLLEGRAVRRAPRSTGEHDHGPRDRPGPSMEQSKDARDTKTGRTIGSSERAAGPAAVAPRRTEVRGPVGPGPPHPAPRPTGWRTTSRSAVRPIADRSGSGDADGPDRTGGRPRSAGHGRKGLHLRPFSIFPRPRTPSHTAPIRRYKPNARGSFREHEPARDSAPGRRDADDHGKPTTTDPRGPNPIRFRMRGP